MITVIAKGEVQMNRLAKFVKEKREEKVLTQEDLAKEINVTKTTISRLENGNRVSFKVLQKLAGFFQVDVTLLRKMMIK